ncbi:MAG: endolytic transglycosylase MltG [Alistipes sp.]|jgi:UPF0755 protein|nr:endolytic transglycosylase MltG [Alistipes sp.]
MKKLTIRLTASFLSIGAVAVLSLFFVVRGGAVRHPGSLYIPNGSDYATLMDSLTAGAAGKRIRFVKPFEMYARHIGLTKRVKPGHYTLRRGQSIISVARMLNLGEQTPVDLVVRPARLPGILAGRVASQLAVDSASLHAAMRDPATLREFGFDNELELFSIFIPNTYEVWWTESPRDFLARMKREYDRFWNDDRVAKLARTRLSRMEAITLASIMVEETQKTDEMPTIAGVYINRLRTGMPLQADPTVKYAMGDFALRRILNKHLKTPSPYNTYVNRGLPPTPITMPSIAAIDAVLNFENHKYLYFCAREDFSGYHSFAETYAAHLQNARRYAAELNRRGIR